jgi:FecR-like protein
MNIQRRLVSLVALTLVFGPSLAMAAEGGKEGIGFYTAVLGKATVTHLGGAQVLPVKLQDEVLFKDVIQTETDSRTRALFQDDSMLTVGENSRVEIDEYIYNPEKNVRLAIVKLMQGQVRALVSKVFKANGSKFEIHTPSAVAAARGTYFTVWVENGQSGIINIGERGRVDFTSGGMTVAVDPGFFSTAYEGQAPSVPLPHHLGQNNNDESGTAVKSAETIQATSPGGLTRALVAVELTTLREAPLVELPAQVLQALNLDTRLLKTLTTLTSLSRESLGEGDGKTTAATTGTSTTGTLTVGPVSVATTSTSAGTVSVGSVTVAAAAPLAPVVSTVLAPVTPLVSTVLAPVTPLVTTVLAPVAPVITTVVAPVTPIINTVLATPPAVISGALSLLK